jgi:hypothetical protein
VSRKSSLNIQVLIFFVVFFYVDGCKLNSGCALESPDQKT